MLHLACAGQPGWPPFYSWVAGYQPRWGWPRLATAAVSPPATTWQQGDEGELQPSIECRAIVPGTGTYLIPYHETERALRLNARLN